MPLQMVGLIDDQEVESGGPSLLGTHGAGTEKLGGTENELAVEEGIAGLLVGLDRGTTLLVEEGKEKIEAAEEFDEPLVDERLRDKDEDPVGPPGCCARRTAPDPSAGAGPREAGRAGAADATASAATGPNWPREQRLNPQ